MITLTSTYARSTPIRLNVISLIQSTSQNSPPIQCNRFLATGSSSSFSSSPHPSSPPPTTTTRTNMSVKTSKPIVPYPSSPQKTIPTKNNPILFPPYALTGNVPPSLTNYPMLYKNPTTISKIRKAALLARKILNLSISLAQTTPGMTTDDIDTVVHNAILEHGAYPSPLNYAGFPKSVCSSVNEVICHGIPDSRPLEPGDIVSFDVSCFLNGYHGDNCGTVIVPGAIEDASAIRLVDCARESLDEAIRVCKPYGCLSDIGNKIQEVVDAYGYDSVKRYRGHGIGAEFHMPPFIKHYGNSDKMQLLPGMVFTIEPMITEGDQECVEWDDNWTVVTCDGGRAAQFEHMVLITQNGVEVLTVDEEDGE